MGLHHAERGKADEPQQIAACPCTMSIHMGLGRWWSARPPMAGAGLRAALEVDAIDWRGAWPSGGWTRPVCMVRTLRARRRRDYFLLNIFVRWARRRAAPQGASRGAGRRGGSTDPPVEGAGDPAAPSVGAGDPLPAGPGVAALP